MDDAADRGDSRAPELEDLLSLCAALHRENVRYILIGGFAVILHGWVRGTKDVDLLVDASIPNVQALKRALATLPDNAAALIADDEVGSYPVVRIADEIVVDLMREACGIDYTEALAIGVERRVVEGVEINLASKELLIRTKDTVRESDALDVRFLTMRMEEESGVQAKASSAVASESRTALIAGATGLVGGHLLDELLASPLYAEVRTLVRCPLDREHPKLTPVIVDFDRLEEHADALDVDDVFCCLGTTIRKAGSRGAFRKVDEGYVANLARLTRAAGARRFLLVSSIGADRGSGNFYLSVKGAAEDAVAAAGFPETHVFRPSLLLGSRAENRPGERVAMLALPVVKPLLVGGLRKYRGVEARTVARAMAVAARSGSVGLSVYTHDEIVVLAAGGGVGERQTA